MRAQYVRLVGELPPLLREGSGADLALVSDLLQNTLQRYADSLGLAEQAQERETIVSALAEPPDTQADNDTTRQEESYENTLKVARIKINDPRLKNAPQNVRIARDELKRLMPLVSHMHLKLVEASKQTETPGRNTICKQLRTRLEELFNRRAECWEILDTYAATLHSYAEQ